jgi:hypothetical protein
MKITYLIWLMVFCGLSCNKDSSNGQVMVKEFNYLFSVVPSYWPLVYDTIFRESDDFQLRMIFSNKDGKSCFRNDTLVFRCHSTTYVSRGEPSPSANHCPQYDESSYYYSISCGEPFDFITYQEGNQLYARFFELPFDFLEPYGPCSFSVWSYDREYVDY